MRTSTTGEAVASLTDAIDSTTAARTLKVDLNYMVAKNVDEKVLTSKGREKLDVLVSVLLLAFSLAFCTVSWL